MLVVIDANVVISVFIKPGMPISLLFKEDLNIFAPELLLREVEENKEIIYEKSELTREEITKALNIIKQRITFIPEREFTYQRESAEKICPDKKDLSYFALALHINCPIWTNDKKLKQQPHIKVYATHELIELLRTRHL